MTTDIVRQRFRVAAICLALTALAFVQQPGRIVTDTKLDLVVAPGSFLERALTMWDADGFFGQVQNQAYGYLFPMGPFFWIGHLADLDPWVVQRAWWALVWCVAFVGMVKLCEAMGIGTPALRLFAGLAFALSARFLTVLGPSSIEVWPSALAPWVLVPLVGGLKRGSPRRQAALSAVAVAAVGGVNAAATFAVVPLAALWLLLAPRGPRRRALMVWWAPLVLLGTLWWLGPLFLLGSYSPPFLDFIESSSVTTTAATALDALRGTTNWVPYISGTAVAGKELFQSPMIVLNAGIILVLGVVGLTMRDLPHRRFLMVGTLTGLTLVTLGHTGNVEGWGAESLQSALDGVLAPIRNTHKFDVVVRIPMILAATHAIAVLRRRGRQTERETVFRRSAVALVAVTALAGASSPAWTGHIALRGDFEALPTYWDDAADWLGAHDDGGTTLLLPASAFGEYVWGTTGDEPLQPLATAAWVVRNSVPLTPPATIRVLDSFTSSFAQGTGSVGLGQSLRRAGVDRLVVRNDLAPQVAAGRTEALYQTLEASPGLEEVASFGPSLGGAGTIDLDTVRTFAHGGWQSDHPAIDVYDVSPGTSPRVQTAEGTPTVVGGPETVGQLDDLDVLGGRSVVLAQDVPKGRPAGDLVVTDGLRRQEVAFGAVDELRSASVARSEPFTLFRKQHDYLDPSDEPWLGTPRLEGATRLTVSSARSEAATPGRVRPSTQAFSAFDGDARSAWVAVGAEAEVDLRLARRTDLGTVTIRSALPPGQRQRLLVTTQDGERSVVQSGGSSSVVRVGAVKRLRIRAENLDGADVAIAEISSPTLAVSRPLDVPATPSSWGAADTIVLGADAARRPGCLVVDDDVRCRSGVEEVGEDAYVVDRTLKTVGTATYRVAISTRPLGGADSGVDAFLQDGTEWTVSASSTVNDDIRSSASQTMDQSSRTGWIADPADDDPTLDVRFASPQTISSIRVPSARGLPASVPSGATLVFDDGTQQRVTFTDAEATFDPVTTGGVEVHLQSAEDARDYVGDDFGAFLPVGIGSLQFPDLGLKRLELDDTVRTLPCGSGPEITVDGRQYRTAVRASRADIASGASVRATTCDVPAIELVGGDHRVTVRASALVAAGTSVLQSESAAIAADADASSKGPSYVLDRHNINQGWSGTSGDDAVTPIRLNGWQQGWIVPAGSSTRVTSTFGPEGLYRGSLVVGALALLALLAVVAVPARARRSTPTPDPSREAVPSAVVLGSVVVSLALVGGTAFIVAGLVGAGLAALAARRGVAAGWAAAAPLAVAVACYVVRPWGSSPVWVGTWHVPQWCVAVSLGVVALSVLRERGDFSRRKGTSTKR